MDDPFHWLIWIGLGGGVKEYACPKPAWSKHGYKKNPPLHTANYLAIASSFP